MLVGILGAFVAVGVPRLAVEIERLAFEVPHAVNTARDEWLPELERRFRGGRQVVKHDDFVKQQVVEFGESGIQQIV